VADAEVEEIERTLAASGGNTVNITVKKADGTTRQVALHKERLEEQEDEEEDKVKSYILQGDRKIGYISLPAFYSDWEGTLGINGCANDVAKEIIKLKKENIEGLMIDLRYNGGGSLQEAVELSGIFIDAGPVAQLKYKLEPKPETLKDAVRGTIYDGPLLLLVNGFSASASEMVAAVMQDYHRALIVGSPTYGKATAQIVLPLDTTINLENLNGKTVASSYIKLTTSRLFRVNGTTAQAHGVQPDIVLPDLTDAVPEREVNEKYALPPTTIDANKYYKPLAPLPVAAADAVAKKEMAASPYFSYVQRYIEYSKTANAKHDISLFIDEAWQRKKAKEQQLEALKEPKDDKAIYKVVKPAAQKQRAHDGELDDEWKVNLLTDAYVKIAYQVLGTMKQ
jgi:carboxyl-terminal processing protease